MAHNAQSNLFGTWGAIVWAVLVSVVGLVLVPKMRSRIEAVLFVVEETGEDQGGEGGEGGERGTESPGGKVKR